MGHKLAGGEEGIENRENLKLEWKKLSYRLVFSKVILQFLNNDSNDCLKPSMHAPI